jgi:uncharacterized beta-barrel protein YwiB (DUF1934 family)
MSQQKYTISLYDENQRQTFQQPFYCKENNNYLDILQQMIDELKKLNLEVDSNKMRLILMGGISPNEKSMVLEKGK